jgi:hypothetical protein
MTIDALDPVFADTADKDSDATFATWAENGWVDEQIRYEAINKALNRIEEKINEIIGVVNGL